MESDCTARRTPMSCGTSGHGMDTSVRAQKLGSGDEAALCPVVLCLTSHVTSWKWSAILMQQSSRRDLVCKSTEHTHVKHLTQRCGEVKSSGPCSRLACQPAWCWLATACHHTLGRCGKQQLSFRLSLHAAWHIQSNLANMTQIRTAHINSINQTYHHRLLHLLSRLSMHLHRPCRWLRFVQL